MIHESTLAERRLLRLWRLVRDGLPSPGRYQRYIVSIAPFLIGIWALTTFYIVAAPVSYKSAMTLILPGSGAGGSINLASIGQAMSQTSSAFSSPTLSPTENYKRLLGADLTLQRGAEQLADGSDALPKPTIKLVDQTNLIMVSITGSTPAQARDRLEALRHAFLHLLDSLREDEAVKREAADLLRLDELEQKLQQAQLRVLQFQGETGLATLDQFHLRLGRVDALQISEEQLLRDVGRESARLERLKSLLGLSEAEARHAQLLKADPLFQSLLDEYADVSTQWTQARATLGDRHLRMTELSAERDKLRSAMIERGKALTGLSSKALNDFMDLAVSGGRERLMDEWMSASGGSAGSGAALEAVREQIQRSSRETERLVREAARLSDLMREQQVAEAVFSSALARLDTNKSDPFASYPLVQTFEPPSLPDRPASPSVKLAIAGAIVASMMVITGFLLLWLRQPIIQLLLPKK